jgi:hypothetical protein
VFWKPDEVGVHEWIRTAHCIRHLHDTFDHISLCLRVCLEAWVLFRAQPEIPREAWYFCVTLRSSGYPDHSSWVFSSSVPASLLVFYYTMSSLDKALILVSGSKVFRRLPRRDICRSIISKFLDL